LKNLNIIPSSIINNNKVNESDLGNILKPQIKNLSIQTNNYFNPNYENKSKGKDSTFNKEEPSKAKKFKCDDLGYIKDLLLFINFPKEGEKIKKRNNNLVLKIRMKKINP